MFPKPLDELTTTKVLTETFCEGKPILSFQSADLETRKELAYLGLKTTLKMIFLNDFVSNLVPPTPSTVFLPMPTIDHVFLMNYDFCVYVTADSWRLASRQHFNFQE
jgi:hypothetical protein